MSLNRLVLMKLHLMLAGFFIPLAMIFFIGGVLYTLDIKGEVDKTEIALILEEPFEPNLAVLTEIAQRELIARGFLLPEAEPSLKKKKKGEYTLRWNELGYSVTLKGKLKKYEASLIVRKRSVLTQVMRIHRAEAGVAFKSLSVIFVLGLVLIFASGIYMALAIPKFRQPFFISLLAGSAIMLLLVVV